MGRKAIPEPAYRGPPEISGAIFTAMLSVILMLVLMQRRTPAAQGRWMPLEGSEKRAGDAGQQWRVHVLRRLVEPGSARGSAGAGATALDNEHCLTWDNA